VKLQTKFREDPTINEGWEAFLPRQLMWLPQETSLRGFLKKLPRGFFEKLDPYLPTPLYKLN